MRWLCIGSVAALAFVAPAEATVLARCSASRGTAYYLQPAVGWHQDDTTSGDTIFVLDEQEKPNVIFRDARGRTLDARSDGGEVTLTHLAPTNFSVLVFYRATGVTESYIVVSGEHRRKLLWTTSKPEVGGITKVGAYVADCE